MNKDKFKRILAIIGIILLVSLPLISILIAIFSKNFGLFMASMFLVVIIPIMIYIFVTVYRRVHRKREDEDEATSNKED